jgi:hypothetical protein
MAAVAEDEFDLYGGEDDVYPQPDQTVSEIHLPLSFLALAFTTPATVRDFEGSSGSYNVHGHGPRPHDW